MSTANWKAQADLIQEVLAREILDSRGNPTIEVDVTLESGCTGRAAVPSGASTGSHEALELRDGDKKRFGGKGCLKAVENVVKKIAPHLLGKDPRNQTEIDNLLCSLDGTENKSKLGANAILGVSLAVARAAAGSAGLPLYKYLGGPTACLLPVPLMNFINGGAHADNALDIQEFMAVPAGAKRFSDAFRMGSEVFHALKSVLKEKGLRTAVGDEGGFAPDLRSNEEAILLMISGIERAGYRAGKDIFIALDCAASSFYDEKKKRYALRSEKKSLTSEGLINVYEKLVKSYPIISIEDGLAEDDWDGWTALTETLGKKIQIVGDDLFVTNIKRLTQGIRLKAANSILIKLNQIGSVTETIVVVEAAKKSGFSTVISHRSGETEDTSIADIAVALSAGQLKSGSMSRVDRIAKYNQLLRIEEELGKSAEYPGLRAFRLA